MSHPVPTSYLVVDQRVRDPHVWAAGFHSASTARAEAGGGPAVLLTDPTDPGRVLAVVPFASPEQARAWRERSGMAQVMDQAGIDPASVVVRVLTPLQVTTEGVRS
ncbi:MAG: hypothetical protein H0X35_07910 [Pseudonocardiales bacterium]|nr:hypothetical protein [Pseudonocardiales bacterium]